MDHGLPQAHAIILGISGMTCAGCAARVEAALKRVPGVATANVNLASEEAHISGAPDIDRAALATAVRQAGYNVRALPSASQSPAAAPFNREIWSIVAGALLTLPLLLPMLLMPLGITLHLPDWLALGLAAPVQFWLGAGFYKGAYHALRNRSGNMDLLVALGTSAAFGLSLYAMALNMPHRYFETAAVVIVMVRLGKWLEKRAKRRTLDALGALQGLWPKMARVRAADGTESEIPADRLRTGDVAVVLPGARIPADGTVTDGISEIDQSLLTGESRAIVVEPGAHVIGGAINGTGRLLIRVTATGTESMLARIIRMLAAAQGAKAPIQRLVDRVSAVFVPVVLGLALLTLAAWLAIGAGIETAVLDSVAVLVIACPCALGLATPAAIMAGTGAGARQGILIRDAVALETAGRIDVVAFDKTGTLTEGKPALDEVILADGADLENANAALTLAAALQEGSSHPLALAVLAAAKTAAAKTAAAPRHARAEGLRTLPGRGIVGTIDGRALFLGNARLLEERGIAAGTLAQQAARLADSGASIAFLAEERSAAAPGRLLALLAFRDAAKPTAGKAMAGLRRLGVTSLLLTGDNKGAALHLAQALGLDDVRAELLPGDKMQVIEALKKEGKRVAMVGDGINDAPALATADLGLAMATGTDVAIETAGIALMRGDPSLVPAAIELARATSRKIMENLAWAFAFNVLGIPLAAFGLLSPALAGAAMALSSVTVVTNALALSRWKPRVG